MHWCSNPLPPRPQGKLLKSLPSVVAAPFGITTVDCAVAETAPRHVASTNGKLLRWKAEFTCMAGVAEAASCCGLGLPRRRPALRNPCPARSAFRAQLDLDRFRDAVLAGHSEPAAERTIAAPHVEQVVAFAEHERRVAEAIGRRVEAAVSDREVLLAFAAAVAGPAHARAALLRIRSGRQSERHVPHLAGVHLEVEHGLLRRDDLERLADGRERQAAGPEPIAAFAERHPS